MLSSRSIAPEVSFVLRILAVAAAGLALLISPVRATGISTWEVAGHDAQNTSYNADETALSSTSIARLHQVWTAPLPTAGGVAIATDQRVYLADRLATGWPQVLVLNSTDGQNLLTLTPAMLHLSGSNDRPETLAHPDDTLIVGALREVVALNPHTGALRWKQPGGATSLTVNASTIYTGKSCACTSLTGYAYDLTTGHRLWQHVKTDGSAPSAIDGHLFAMNTTAVGASETNIYDPTTGRLQGTVTVPVLHWLGDATHAYAFVPALPATPKTSATRGWIGQMGPGGATVWRSDLGAARTGNPVLAGHTLYVPSDRHSPGVVALDARTGHYLWGADVGRSASMAGANGLLYVLNGATGRLSVLNMTTGRELRVITLPAFKGGGAGALQVAGGQVYVMGAKALTALGV
jgi:outer membrane protein assembly factor BamB